MKTFDTTLWQHSLIVGEKEKWIFRCNCCDYSAFFILWKGEEISTGCQMCPGDMERIYQVKESR